jgi:hypothetical protein
VPRILRSRHTYQIFSDRISEGQYYEAHQQLRVVASRYVKSSDWESAIDILYSGALALLKAGQGGSGGDLGCFLVDVLGKSEKGCGAVEKGAFCARSGGRAVVLEYYVTGDLALGERMNMNADIMMCCLQGSYCLC